MGKPLSLETRRAIVRMIETTDCPQAEIARVFKIGHRSVQRYWSLFCQTGDVDSHAKFGGHKKATLAEHKQTVIKLIGAKPDITLEALKIALAEKNITSSVSAIERFLKSLGYSNKKNGIRARTKETGRSRAS